MQAPSLPVAINPCPGSSQALAGLRLSIRIVVAAACLLLAPAPGLGDEPGPSYLSGNASRVTAANLEGAGPGSRVAAEDSQAATAFTRFALGAATLDLGVDYQYTHYEYDAVDSRNRDLHRLQLPVWLSIPGDGWRIRAHAAPGIFTSSNVLKDFFDRGSRDDIYVSARIEASGADPSRPWIVGVAHDRAFGESTTYPVIGLNLAPRDGIDIRLAWPDPAIHIRPSDRHRVSLELFPAGSQWHVRTDDFTSEWDYRFEAWRSQLSLNLSLFEGTSLDLSLGYEFDRRHHFTDDQGIRIDARAESQWFFAIGFRLGNGSLPLAHGYHINRRAGLTPGAAAANHR